MLGNDLTARCGKCGCDRITAYASGMVKAPEEAQEVGSGVFVTGRCRGCGRLGGVYTHVCASGHLHAIPLGPDDVASLVGIAETQGALAMAPGATMDPPAADVRPAGRWEDDPWKDIQSMLERAFNGGGDDD